ncbi:predicted protein [Naegleria gruberi]|uniref:Predicted protein n=1 Tax=Naegleria gruberi TaxID=5762 RepID=D2VBK8_NAEGR|nr:uncharacterized protein NAEGRDRAFT_66251 [Naegleria gruberi]EFC45814.1 predicted protein [Naegleria gruberi]|eukprot:XP_002678558.1 predicted protein [Naegleria gruberi strain NEG-M]
MEYQPLNQQTKYDPNQVYQQPQQVPPQNVVYSQQPIYTQEQQYYASTQPIYQQSHVVTTTTQGDVDYLEKQKQDQTSMMLFIIGFFVGIVWIVNFILHRNSPSESARKFAKASIICFALSFVFAAVAVGIYLIVFFSIFQSAY